MPRWELVTERLLHQEIKRVSTLSESDRKTLITLQRKKKTYICHFCHKPGHFTKDCRKCLASLKKQVVTKKREPSSDGEAFVTTHALCSCNFQRKLDCGLRSSVEGPAEGAIKFDAVLPSRNTQKCRMENVLFVPKLSYSLLSVSKACESGKTMKFNKSGCQILNQKGKIVASAILLLENLYYLKYQNKGQNTNIAKTCNEMLWHQRHGHLGEQNLKSLVHDQLVRAFDYNVSSNIGFCVSCVGGSSIGQL